MGQQNRVLTTDERRRDTTQLAVAARDVIDQVTESLRHRGFRVLLEEPLQCSSPAVPADVQGVPDRLLADPVDHRRPGGFGTTATAASSSASSRSSGRGRRLRGRPAQEVVDGRRQRGGHRRPQTRRRRPAARAGVDSVTSVRTPGCARRTMARRVRSCSRRRPPGRRQITPAAPAAVRPTLRQVGEHPSSSRRSSGAAVEYSESDRAPWGFPSGPAAPMEPRPGRQIQPGAGQRQPAGRRSIRRTGRRPPSGPSRSPRHRGHPDRERRWRSGRGGLRVAISGISPRRCSSMPVVSPAAWPPGHRGRCCSSGDQGRRAQLQHDIDLPHRSIAAPAAVASTSLTRDGAVTGSGGVRIDRVRGSLAHLRDVAGSSTTVSASPAAADPPPAVVAPGDQRGAGRRRGYARPVKPPAAFPARRRRLQPSVIGARRSRRSGVAFEHHSGRGYHGNAAAASADTRGSSSPQIRAGRASRRSSAVPPSASGARPPAASRAARPISTLAWSACRARADRVGTARGEGSPVRRRRL